MTSGVILQSVGYTVERESQTKDGGTERHKEPRFPGEFLSHNNSPGFPSSEYLST